jgi:hypothetical protein
MAFASALCLTLVCALPQMARADEVQDTFRMPQPDRLSAAIAAMLPAWVPIKPAKLLGGHSKPVNHSIFRSAFSLGVLHTQLNAHMPLELGVSVGTSAQDYQHQVQGWLRPYIYSAYVNVTW